MRIKIEDREFLEPDLSQQTGKEIELYLETLEEQEKFKSVILELIKKYDDFDETRSYTEILEIADVSENVFRRIESKEAYNGPCLSACIRIGLAIGCDNMDDFDRILLARDLEPLSPAKCYTYRKYKRIVEIILAKGELPPQDGVKLFAQYEKKMERRD